MSRTYDVEVRGHTYPHKGWLQELGLWWVPDKRAWIAWHMDTDKIEIIRDFCTRRGLKLTLRAPEYVAHEERPQLQKGQATLGDYATRERW